MPLLARGQGLVQSAGLTSIDGTLIVIFRFKAVRRLNIIHQIIHRIFWIRLIENNGSVKLFSSYGGYGDGAHERDFIYVDDVVKMNLWFFTLGNIEG